MSYSEQQLRNIKPGRSLLYLIDLIVAESMVDWSFAQGELLEKQGVDLHKDMEHKLLVLEEQYKREKVKADLVFEKQRQVWWFIFVFR